MLMQLVGSLRGVCVELVGVFGEGFSKLCQCFVDGVVWEGVEGVCCIVCLGMCEFECFLCYGVIVEFVQRVVEDGWIGVVCDECYFVVDVCCEVD